MIKQLKICSSVYDVECKDSSNDPDNGHRLAGQAFHREKIIEISTKGYCQQSIKQTLFHEGIHCVSTEHGFDFNEDMTERLSNAMYAFMIDNREFVKEIIK